MTIPPNPHPEQVEAALRPFAFEGATIPRGLSPDSYWFTDALTGRSITIGQVLAVRAVLASLANRPADDGEREARAIWCGREAEARRAEADGATLTAKFTREGRYDEQGYMPVLIDAARLALLPPQPEGVKRP